MKKMNKIILISIISGITIIAIVAGLLIPTSVNSSSDKPDSEILSVSYVETNKDIQSQLAMQNISMSSALKLNGFSIKTYCTFFADESIQKAIEYCTSTELLDSDGRSTEPSAWPGPAYLSYGYGNDSWARSPPRPLCPAHTRPVREDLRPFSVPRPWPANR